MDIYNFKIVNFNREVPLEDKGILMKRPLARSGASFEVSARYFVPSDDLEIAINTAIAVGEPLLITGESGTGKTQTANAVAYNLGIEPVIHFQVGLSDFRELRQESYYFVDKSSLITHT